MLLCVSIVHCLKRNRPTDIENKLVVASEERKGGRGNVGVGD